MYTQFGIDVYLTLQESKGEGDKREGITEGTADWGKGELEANTSTEGQTKGKNRINGGWDRKEGNKLFHNMIVMGVFCMSTHV